ncbi:MAG: ChbG/HpnK family deacetylase [Eggerthellaceae bacterium]|jgi:predicted glycoside hydrolase/deacetylase ChbG (UPF0249 family)|nr:ChbG/HpnK family deacetylase [Eggerthellaceae bacterium]MCH4220385.1 ChbG/HpnK family deacetylase [Eggerthellaceae bacterium]
MNPLYHADDFGITPEQSRLILGYSSLCGGCGALNSLSILVNSPQFKTCADILEPFLGKIHVCLHVNIVEGHCCADPQTIPLLVNEQGMFAQDFAHLLFMSLGQRHKELKQQIKLEISAQFDRYLRRFPQMRNALRVDSHQHFHLIPLVFDALNEVIREQDCSVEYIRIPAEPVVPFLQTPSVWMKIPPINWIKHWLLNFLWRFDKTKALARKNYSAVFCGINLSGHMTPDRVMPLIPHLQAYAKRHEMELELLFHPGGLDNEDSALNPTLTDFVAFYMSPYRAQEGHTLQRLVDDNHCNE